VFCEVGIHLFHREVVSNVPENMCFLALCILHCTNLDLGVDPNKSTWVGWVGSVLPGAVDSKSNLELKSDFAASRLEIDLN